MKIVVLHHDRDAYAGEIVATALVRSFTAAQVEKRTYSNDARHSPALVLVNPGESAAQSLKRALSAGGKALVLGDVAPGVADLIGIEFVAEPLARDMADAVVSVSEPWNESPAAISYDGSHPLAALAPLRRRALCRFDFENEWNNLGYGRVGVGAGPWSLAGRVSAAGASPIARVLIGEQSQSLYCAVRDTSGGAALWFNRAVGPVDSVEWNIVEKFFSDYRDDLIALPALSELPAGYDAAFTMRLDCDEAVASASPLFELYADKKIPLSLAIRTDQQFSPADFKLMKAVRAVGGCVLSHSVKHEPNWGGSYERALAEAQQSKHWLEEMDPQAEPTRFAVSPFHQNPPYAVLALADAGYEAFVGGIISTDPEYLLGRAGRAPLVTSEIVSLSAQSMLHGDCFHRYGDSIQPYVEGFNNHVRAGSIYGYLDHPFSARYQYGWESETERTQAHEQLLSTISGNGTTWRPSLGEALEFLCDRNRATLSAESGEPRLESACADTRRRFAFRWKGCVHHG